MSAILRKANSVQHMNQTVYPSLLGDHVKCQSHDNLGRKRKTEDERHNFLCPPSVSTFNSIEFISIHRKHRKVSLAMWFCKG